MRLWELAATIFFVYLGVVALVSPRPRPAQRKLWAGIAAGLVFVTVVSAVRYQVLLHDWLAPPIALLLGYWTSGLLFVAPNPSQERILLRLDDRLGVLRLARRMPAVVRVALEAAYVGVYPLIPVALVLHVVFVPGADPTRFWAVVLITDYICFGVLAWVQTRPPRVLENREPWRSAVRRFNQRLLGAASIQVNTFPSGHAAEALAAALLVTGAPWPIVLWMFLNALAISAGAVLGRYHFAADAIAGWVVALAVWAIC
jgi:hypothetical protein